MTVKPIPDGFHTVTPFVTARGIAKLIDFLHAAFDAEVNERIEGPDGVVRHAEVKIGDSIVMLGEPQGDQPAQPTSFYLYLPDCDAVYDNAVHAGAAPIMPVTDMFYGDRCGAVSDPVGNTWWLATRKENLTPEEILRRQEAFAKQQPSP